MNKTYLILAVAIITNALANILIKIGMVRVGGMDILNFSDLKNKFLLNYIIWLGIFCFGMALFTYSYVLSKMNLSIAYPIMTSVGFVIVILASALFLNEKINLVQIIGILLIITGVWLTAS